MRCPVSGPFGAHHQNNSSWLATWTVRCAVGAPHDRSWSPGQLRTPRPAASVSGRGSLPTWVAKRLRKPSSVLKSSKNWRPAGCVVGGVVGRLWPGTWSATCGRGCRGRRRRGRRRRVRGRGTGTAGNGPGSPGNAGLPGDGALPAGGAGTGAHCCGHPLRRIIDGSNTLPTDRRIFRPCIRRPHSPPGQLVPRTERTPTAFDARRRSEPGRAFQRLCVRVRRGHQRSRWTTSSKGRRSGVVIGLNGWSAG